MAADTGATLGDCLRAARDRAGLTHAEAAKLIGISQGNVSDYERGAGKNTNPTLGMLVRFAAAYGTTVSKVLKAYQPGTKGE